LVRFGPLTWDKGLNERVERGVRIAWRGIGLGAPARRALVDAKLYKVSDLRKISLKDLTALHGMGKSAIARLKVIMDAKRIKFLP
jgi:hypothetical protein